MRRTPKNFVGSFSVEKNVQLIVFFREKIIRGYVNLEEELLERLLNVDKLCLN